MTASSADTPVGTHGLLHSECSSVTFFRLLPSAQSKMPCFSRICPREAQSEHRAASVHCEKCARHRFVHTPNRFSPDKSRSVHTSIEGDAAHLLHIALSRGCPSPSSMEAQWVVILSGARLAVEDWPVLVENDTELRSGCTSRMRERVPSVHESRRSNCDLGTRERVSGMQESRRSIKQCQACKKAGGAGGFRHHGKGFRHAGSKWSGCDSGMTERVSGMQEAGGAVIQA